MALPIRTTLDDIREVCRYLASKPAGATVAEGKAVIDSKHLDGRKLTALKSWGLIDEQDNERLKLTPAGRQLTKDAGQEQEVLLSVIKGVPAYSAIVERAAHRHEDSLDTTEVGAHWHEHFREDAGDNESIINDRAVCFFHVAAGAGLGTIIPGRRGKPTRMSFSADALTAYVSSGSAGTLGETRKAIEETPEVQIDLGNQAVLETQSDERKPPLGQGIFIAHGKNKKPLEQLKKILEQFHIPYKVAVEEPNLGRPISGKVRQIMQACNCAILIFTADEEFKNKKSETIWRPSENVVYELGATGYLYDNRIVILKEETVTFPSNFSDVGHISFEQDQLDAKAMDVLKELIGFGIVKVST